MGIHLPRAIGWLLTFLFVALAFVVFRAQSFSDIWSIYRPLVGLDGLSFEYGGAGRHVVIFVGLAVVLLLPTSQRIVQDWLPPRRWTAVATAAVLLATLLQVGIGANQEFIYFQF